MHGDSCYYKGHPKQTWDISRSICADLGSALVSIGSQDEQDFVASLAGRNTWIGLNNLVDVAIYSWDNGTQLGDYTNWNNGEPNNHVDSETGEGEHCIEMSKNDAYKWNDKWCWIQRIYVCERPVDYSA